MGLDANTHIWLGVQMGDSLDPLGSAPDDLHDRIADEGEIQVAGLTFRKFYHAEEPIGFGVELLDRGWREGSMELDLDAMDKKVQEMMPRVKTAFSVLQITVEPKVWLATDLP